VATCCDASCAARAVPPCPLHSTPEKRRPQVVAARHRARLDASSRTLLAPTPAQAVDCFAAATPPPGASGPIIVFPPVNDFITCTNTDDRFNNPALPQAGAVIRLSTTGDLHSIDLDNSAI
jgi:hypothetical protein